MTPWKDWNFNNFLQWLMFFLIRHTSAIRFVVRNQLTHFAVLVHSSGKCPIDSGRSDYIQFLDVFGPMTRGIGEGFSQSRLLRWPVWRETIMPPQTERLINLLVARYRIVVPHLKKSQLNKVKIKLKLSKQFLNFINNQNYSQIWRR